MSRYVGAVPSVVPSVGLAGYFPLAGNAIDARGLNTPGTMSGLASSINGMAGMYPRTTYGAEIPSSSNVDNLTEFSVAFITRPQNFVYSTQVFVGKNTAPSTSNGAWAIRFANPNIVVAKSYSTGSLTLQVDYRATGIIPSINNSIVAVFNLDGAAAKIRLYVNKCLVRYTTTGGTGTRKSDAGLPIIIGANTGITTHSLLGILAQVRIYKRQLTLGDVMALDANKNATPMRVMLPYQSIIPWMLAGLSNQKVLGK